jgi:hypothetical protein
MKAYRLDDFTSLDDLRLRDEDDPRLQRGEVLVRLHAVSLNFRDIAMLRRFRPGGDRRVREASRGVEESRRTATASFAMSSFAAAASFGRRAARSS